MVKSEIPPKEALYPVPVVLVSVFDSENKRTNVITIAWCGIVASMPPQISISIRPSRYSHKLITQERSFVINIPSAGILKKVDLCGVVSGKDVDKFKLCAFTPEPSSKVSASLIKECPVNIECTLTETIKLGSHDMFIGKVLAVHIDGAILNPDSSIDYAKANPVIFNGGGYWSIGDKLGFYGFSKK